MPALQCQGSLRTQLSPLSGRRCPTNSGARAAGKPFAARLPRRSSSNVTSSSAGTIVIVCAESREAMNKKPQAVVVGAGPGGALAAIALAQQGFSVEVFEAREEPDPAAQEAYRSYAMVKRMISTSCVRPHASCMKLAACLHSALIICPARSLVGLVYVDVIAGLLVLQIVNKRGTDALNSAGIDLAPHRKVPFAGVSIQVSAYMHKNRTTTCSTYCSSPACQLCM